MTVLHKSSKPWRATCWTGFANQQMLSFSLKRSKRAFNTLTQSTSNPHACLPSCTVLVDLHYPSDCSLPSKTMDYSQTFLMGQLDMLPSDLNLTIFIYWFHSRNELEKANILRQCPLTLHDRTPWNPIVGLVSAVQIPMLVMDGRIVSIATEHCNRAQCMSCQLMEGETSFKFYGPWTCKSAALEAQKSHSTVESVKRAWLQDLQATLPQRCEACQLIGAKTTLFTAALIASGSAISWSSAKGIHIGSFCIITMYHKNSRSRHVWFKNSIWLCSWIVSRSAKVTTTRYKATLFLYKVYTI